MLLSLGDDSSDDDDSDGKLSVRMLELTVGVLTLFAGSNVPDAEDRDMTTTAAIQVGQQQRGCVTAATCSPKVCVACVTPQNVTSPKVAGLPM